jgi:hypothetical protein
MPITNSTRVILSMAGINEGFLFLVLELIGLQKYANTLE